MFEQKHLNINTFNSSMYMSKHRLHKYALYLASKKESALDESFEQVLMSMTNVKETKEKTVSKPIKWFNSKAYLSEYAKYLPKCH